MIIVQLTHDVLPLAKAEVLALFPNAQLQKNLVFLSTERTKIKRMSSVAGMYKLLFTCSENKLLAEIEHYPWQRSIKNPYAVRFIDNSGKTLQTKQQRVANLVYQQLTNPDVSLRKPRTIITFIAMGTTIYCTQQLPFEKPEYQSRLPHRRKAFSPVSLHPKLARVMVNLTGSSSSIYDPFCGTGGLLLEAGLMNLKLAGNDIDARMITATKTNLKQYELTALLTNNNALTIQKKFPYIVTDVPYGRNSPKQKELYKDFFSWLDTHLTKRAVIALPSNTTITLPKSLKRTYRFTYYLHKSLSKQILVLEK